MLLYLRIEPGAGYVTHVLPGVLVFGLGLAATVAPVTAAALSAADERHAGVASGVNNAVARTAGLVTVAVLPLAVGLSGTDFAEAGPLVDGFHAAMVICAAMSALGGLLAFTLIRPQPTPPPPAGEDDHCVTCGVEGPPLRTRAASGSTAQSTAA